MKSNNLLRKKYEWERHNHQVLLRLVQTSSDVSVESVKAAGLVTSFLLFLIYKGIRGMLAVGSLFFRGPQMVRQVAPQHKPLEYHEFNQAELEKKYFNVR